MLKLAHVLSFLLVLELLLLLPDRILLFLTHSRLSIIPSKHSPLLFDLLLSLIPHLPFN